MKTTKRAYNYKQKQYDIEGERTIIPVMCICCTCGACSHCRSIYDPNNIRQKDTACHCNLHNKDVDHWDEPCDDFR
jgi:hypothetical protein